MSQTQQVSRRRFLLLAGGAVGVSMITCAGLTVAGYPVGSVDFVRSNCLSEANMKKILVAYASKCGSTGEVAQAIGEVLCSAGATVDVARVQDVRDAAAYDAIVIGSATRMGKALSDAAKFAERNRARLAGVPTAYFHVGTTLREDTPENRSKAAASLNGLVSVKEPVSLGLFAGKIDLSKIEQPWRLMVSLDKSGAMGEGDWRDWDAIRAWAGSLVPLMVKTG